MFNLDAMSLGVRGPRVVVWQVPDSEGPEGVEESSSLADAAVKAISQV